MKYRKLLVLGGTGNTGRWFVELATKRGHRVTAVARSKSGLEDRDGLEIVQGDVLDPAALQGVMHGHDAVVSCLGIRKKSPSDPRSALLSPEDFTTRSTRYIVDAMKTHGVERLVAISSAGVGDSWSTVDPALRAVIQSTNVAIIFRDLDNMEDVLRSCGLDTLAVRPVALVGGAPTGLARIVDKFGTSSRISTGDVAQWMLDAVVRPAPFQRPTEMIGSG